MKRALSKTELDMAASTMKRVFESLESHDCTVTEILAEPAPFMETDMWMVHLAFTSPTLGDLKTKRICLTQAEAQKYQPGYKFKLMPNTGVVVN